MDLHFSKFVLLICFNINLLYICFTVPPTTPVEMPDPHINSDSDFDEEELKEIEKVMGK